MKIEFGGLTEKRIEEFNGVKGAINLKSIDKNDVKFLSARLEPGSSVGMHKHMDTRKLSSFCPERQRRSATAKRKCSLPAVAISARAAVLTRL